ncbi:MAG TPA: YqcI/YcgG family protein [Solirubrobacteraceae bacterium]|nr:YqcI/YcgG family protein [Solirubrobacteraceae bacterium]
MAAVARLLEELGELAESLASPSRDAGERASELADLWIITTAIADQFLGRVAEPSSYRQRPPASRDLFGELIAAAGQIARVVNYYDGPKAPRSLEDWTSLSAAVAEFHRALADVSYAHGVDLSAAVNEKLSLIPALDGGRFPHRDHDPSTASSLEKFRLIHTTTTRPSAGPARLWGAPEWSSQPFASNVETIVATLTSFTRAAIPERLDAYIIPGPPLNSMELLADWFRRLLVEISSRDPQHEQTMRGHVNSAGWQFTFDGLRMFVAVFSPLYDARHPRHSPAGTFVALRPEKLLDRRELGASCRRSVNVQIQRRPPPADVVRPCPHELEDTLVWAHLYLLPRWEGDAAAEWWRDLG